MTASVFVVLGVGASLAWVNGANDVSKGVATLVGGGVTDYRRAIAWGAGWTAVGGLFGALFASAMLAAFGKGLLAPGTTPTFAAAVAVVLGAAGWVLFATRTGLPVSTTHAIVGALVGVATLAYGPGAVQWAALGGKVLLPLLASPFAAFALTGLLLWSTRQLPGSATTAVDCVCVEAGVVGVASGGGSAQSALTSPGFGLEFTTGATQACAAGRPAAARLTLNHLHWLTSGATSLARGMNDAPKMVALLVAASALGGQAVLSTPMLFTVVVAAMVGGSLIAGRRVTTVLAEKVTPMDHREGFVANLVTAGLVTAGAVYGLPMSTTHVSSSGILSAGALRGSLNARTLREILLGWLVTLPCAALIGMASYALVARLGS